MVNVNTTTHPSPPKPPFRCFSVLAGEGWTLLEPGELIQDGDQVFSGYRYGWGTEGLKVGKPQQPGYRPRRRKILQPVRTYVPAEPELEFPHFWLNTANVVYVALNKDCPGHWWDDRHKMWRECAAGPDDSIESTCRTLVAHVKFYQEFFKSIVPSRARELADISLLPGMGFDPMVKALYLELIYAVARKFPGETRHDTALRYIREAEECPKWAIAQAEARKKIYDERNENAS